MHFALDTRIYYRMCRTLSNYYRVSLIAVHDKRENRNGIEILPFPRYHNRKLRVLLGWLHMYFRAIRVRAGVYHLHDPELIPCGLLLRMTGKKVILDIHENIAEDIFDKPWIRHQRRAYMIFHFFEKLACRYFDIILAERSYEKRYTKMNARFTTVQNFCDTGFFASFGKKEYRTPQNLFYIGIILENRGILQIAEALHMLTIEGYDFHFHCVGELYSDLDRKIRALPYYDRISNRLHFYGRLPLEKGYAMASEMDIGLCIIHPMRNSRESYPTKLFEYMACGLPVITSRFPLYQEVIEQNGCGFCVDPLKPSELRDAILEMHRDVEKSERMGENGKKAVFEKYNWNSQIPHLIRAYDVATNRNA